MQKENKKKTTKKSIYKINSQLVAIKFQDPRNDWSARRNIAFFEKEITKINEKFWAIDEKHCVEENGVAKVDERGNLVIKKELLSVNREEKEKILEQPVEVCYYSFQASFKNGTRNKELFALNNQILNNLMFLMPEEDDVCPSDEEAENEIKRIEQENLNKIGRKFN